MEKRFAASLIFLLGLFFLIWLENRRPDPIELIPSMSGNVEYCLTCHQELPEISSSHPVEVFGCVICHGGQRLALDPSLAHSTMRGGKNPSDLMVVEQSCGGDACHSGPETDDLNHIQRVLTSIQTTYAGAIASVRYSFGAQQDLKAQMGILAIKDHQSATQISSLSAFNPAQETQSSLISFADNCLYCHLSANPLPDEDFSRFTGCAACHSPLNSEGEETHSLTTAMPYTQCNTCHNRGNYSLLDMKFHQREDQYTGRFHEYYQPIAQFVRCEYTLDCIDCHTRFEAMGDGDIHNNQAEIQYVQCLTCHGTLSDLPKIHTIENGNDPALGYAALNPVIDLKIGDTILETEKGEPLWNIRRLPDGTYELFGKATGQQFVFRPVAGTNCGQDPELQESHYCHECHAVER
jgi:hypothetical protein